MWSPAQDQTARTWQVWGWAACCFAALGSATSLWVRERPEAPPSRSLSHTPARALVACQVRWEGAQRRAGPCLDAETERGRQAVEPIAKVSTDSPCGSDTSEYPRWAQEPTPVVICAP